MGKILDFIKENFMEGYNKQKERDEALKQKLQAIGRKDTKQETEQRETPANDQE